MGKNQTAKRTSGLSIASALPKESIGCIDVLDFAEGGARELLQGLGDIFMPIWANQVINPSRVMATESGLPALVRGLVDFGHYVGNAPLLPEIFGRRAYFDLTFVVE